jgi:hypothetical protein
MARKKVTQILLKPAKAMHPNGYTGVTAYNIGKKGCGRVTHY